MNYDPYAMIRRVRDLPGRLNRLGEHLRVLASRVRESVSEAVGETVSCTIKDSLGRLWSGQRLLEAPFRESPPQRERDWYGDHGGDPWDSSHDSWDDSAQCSRYAASEPDRSPTRSSAMALAVQMAGWWMYRRGTLCGALGLGMVVGSVALLGGRLARTGLSLIESASVVFALNNALGAASSVLADA